MKQLFTSILMMLAMTVLLGVVYPFTMTGIAQAGFSREAGGSIIGANGRAVGSMLIGQHFVSPEYFHGRPSAHDYDGMYSGGSNDGPTKKGFIEAVSRLAIRVRKENGRTESEKVPADLVLASGSGLDPDISRTAALFQAERIAENRGLEQADIIRLIGQHCRKRYFGFIGDAYVNVLELNMALDAMDGKK
ncbi:MAG TPA: potassium-transporting ATPase subunit KdpC [Spirochaetota bacterium]|nr:potassium-transporting ATPase subunit KdpC [Spirochaetota bacterium]HPG52416.1 potassium-transporting ATPase subunit KdpC [Spirochaetota bacterium]HPN11402.1 potassium-transporting ATPase subunit KdpC [Spirochaetota bacterium]HQL83627.1 potassium-transporting ATPase subunit KdpC [Spirochaetota bacterium]